MRTPFLFQFAHFAFHKSSLTVALVLLFGGSLVTNRVMGQSNTLIGTWRLDISKTVENIDSSNKIRYDTLPAALKERAIRRMNGREFIFSQNGNITVNWRSYKGSEVSAGKWIKNELDGELSITIDNTTSKYNLEFLAANMLVMRAKNKRGFFGNLYLQKVN